MERILSDEQKANAPKMDWDELMETLKKRLEEQKERHEGGSKWIGTGGTSPFGHGGSNPQGIRIGGKGGKKSAVKVWDQRAYRDYDDTQELGTRNIKVALRRLRKFARIGALKTSWTWTAPSRAQPPTLAGWTSRCGPSATTTSRCCC
jgi:uncharacterized protein with von Willebrand factor type A (vWA) domain